MVYYIYLMQLSEQQSNILIVSAISDRSFGSRMQIYSAFVLHSQSIVIYSVFIPFIKVRLLDNNVQ